MGTQSEAQFEDQLYAFFFSNIAVLRKRIVFGLNRNEFGLKAGLGSV